MKTTVEDISSVKKRLIIEIEAGEIDKRINETYRRFGKTAKIKGFRQGKVPRRILESYFGDSVIEDVTNSLIKETLPEAIEETGMFPIGMPAVENEILKAGQDYRYSAVMEVKPEFDLKDYLGLEVDKEECNVTGEDVDRHLEGVREAWGNLKSVEEDRGIKEGDHVIIDYEGFDGESAIEGIKSQNFSVKIGGKRFYPGFEEALIGLKKGGPYEVKIDFEKDYFHVGLAGKTVNFKVNVTDIKEAQLPDLNDDFVKGLGAGFESLEELKKKIEEDLFEAEKKRIDDGLKERLLEKVSDGVEFELPESLVEPEISSSIDSIRQNLTRSGSSIEKSGLDEEKLREEIRPAAEKRVKGMLVLGEIARKENLTVDDTDIAEGFKKLSQSMGGDPEAIRKYYETNNLIGAFRQTLLREKTLNYLIENAKVTQKDTDKTNDKKE